MIRRMISVLLISLSFSSLAIAAGEQAELNQPVKDLVMTDTNGKKHRFSDFKGKLVVLEWLNYGCPFVKKHYGAGNMQKLQTEETKNGAVWLTIASSAKGKQGYYEPKALNEENAKQGNKATATIIDSTGEIGKYFDAKVTPHMYVINAKGELVYRGAIDDKATSDAEDIAGAKNYVKAALADVRAGRKVAEASTKAYGCGVKYP